MAIATNCCERGPSREARAPLGPFWEIGGYDHVRAYAHPGYRQKLLSFLEGENASKGNPSRGAGFFFG